MRYRDLTELNNLDATTRTTYETLATLRHVRAAGSVDTAPRPHHMPRSDGFEQLANEGLLERGTRGMLWWKRPTYSIAPAGVDVLEDTRTKIATLQRDIRGKTDAEAELHLQREGYTPGQYALTMLILDAEIATEDLGRGNLAARVERAMEQREPRRASERSARSFSRARASPPTRAYAARPVTPSPAQESEFGGLVTDVLLVNALMDASRDTHPDPSPAEYEGRGGAFGGGGASASFDPPSREVEHHVAHHDTGWGASTQDHGNDSWDGGDFGDAGDGGD